MSWSSGELLLNKNFKYYAVYRELDWRAKPDAAKIIFFDKIAVWLRSQMPELDYFVSASHGLVMFREREAQTMFLLAWTNDG